MKAREASSWSTAHRRGIAGAMPGMDLLDGIVARSGTLSNGGMTTRPAGSSFPISAIVTLQLQAGLDGFLAIEKAASLQTRTLEQRPETLARELEPRSETAAEVERLLGCLQRALQRGPVAGCRRTGE